MRWKNFIIAISFLLLILGITYWTSGYSFEHFTEGFVAWGTLMLAGATFLLVRHSEKQEKRDKKERNLNKIIEWAEQIMECGRVKDLIYYENLKIYGGTDTAPGEFIAADVLSKVNHILTRSIQIVHVSYQFDRDLQDKVKEIKELLKKEHAFLEAQQHAILKPELKNISINPKEFTDTWDLLDKSTNSLIKMATDSLGKI